MITITKNEETEDFFHRFTKIKVCGKPWKVGAIDNLSFPDRQKAKKDYYRFYRQK